jgi:DNA polymerase I-like protein with 3'-5' exonuclease and polymerase domains
MLEAYHNNFDLHAITAAAMNGYSLEDFMMLPDDLRDDRRSGGKAGNFGLLYGMMPPGFQAYARTTYGVIMTLEEATKRRDGFFAKYSRLLEWHAESKAFAHARGFIRSPLGRVRHLPLINSKDREMVAQAELDDIGHTLWPRHRPCNRMAAT